MQSVFRGYFLKNLGVKTLGVYAARNNNNKLYNQPRDQLHFGIVDFLLILLLVLYITFFYILLLTIWDFFQEAMRRAEERRTAILDQQEDQPGVW